MLVLTALPPVVLDLVVAVIDYFEVSQAGLVFGTPSISVASPSVRASGAWPGDRRLLRLPCRAAARLLVLGGRGRSVRLFVENLQLVECADVDQHSQFFARIEDAWEAVAQ